MANILVENACEKALFATPEAVAAAVAYVEARYLLLVASAALAARDPSYQPTVERLRRGIEEDRFGVAAQVFSTRGCNAPDCKDFAVLRDSRRIVANMKRSTFATHVEAHALAWNPGAAASALAATPADTVLGRGEAAVRDGTFAAGYDRDWTSYAGRACDIERAWSAALRVPHG